MSLLISIPTSAGPLRRRRRRRRVGWRGDAWRSHTLLVSLLRLPHIKGHPGVVIQTARWTADLRLTRLTPRRLALWSRPFR